MTATPTPGDLSARHVERLREIRLNLGAKPQPIDQPHADALDAAIAALSALPAAGEAARYFASGPEGEFFVDDNLFAERLIYRAGFVRDEWTITDLTTPQPSAAEPKCGCGRPGEYESKDGPACNKYFRCKDAAVGAQGDGEEAAIDRMIARYLELEPGEKENGVATDHQPTRDFCRELLRAAAPAAGKGVDDAAALADFTEYFVKNYPGPHTIISDPNWHAPRIFRAAKRALSALTRQPVAGDGKVTLTAAEITDLAEFVGLRVTCPDDIEPDTEIDVYPCPAEGVLNEGEPSDPDSRSHYRYVAVMSDYPEEGCCGLGNEIAPAATPTDGGEGS